MIDGFKFGPTARQLEEGKRIMAAGLDVVLIGWKNGIMHVSPWVAQADKRSCFYSGGKWTGILQNYLKGVE